VCINNKTDYFFTICRNKILLLFFLLITIHNNMNIYMLFRVQIKEPNESTVGLLTEFTF